jgi:hypothetical protein
LQEFRPGLSTFPLYKPSQAFLSCTSLYKCRKDFCEFADEGVGYAVKIDGRMDGDLYLQILKDELQNSLQYHGFNPPNIIFQ